MPIGTWTLIWSLFADIGASPVATQIVPLLVSLAIVGSLMYQGVRAVFHEPEGAASPG
jgi:hypothetical protein